MGEALAEERFVAYFIAAIRNGANRSSRKRVVPRGQGRRLAARGRAFVPRGDLDAAVGVMAASAASRDSSSRVSISDNCVPVGADGGRQPFRGFGRFWGWGVCCLNVL